MNFVRFLGGIHTRKYPESELVFKNRNRIRTGIPRIGTANLVPGTSLAAAIQPLLWGTKFYSKKSSKLHYQNWQKNFQQFKKKIFIPSDLPYQDDAFYIYICSKLFFWGILWAFYTIFQPFYDYFGSLFLTNRLIWQKNFFVKMMRIYPTLHVKKKIIQIHA